MLLNKKVSTNSVLVVSRLKGLVVLGVLFMLKRGGGGGG